MEYDVLNAVRIQADLVIVIFSVDLLIRECKISLKSQIPSQKVTFYMKIHYSWYKTGGPIYRK